MMIIIIIIIIITKYFNNIKIGHKNPSARRQILTFIPCYVIFVKVNVPL
jgi:hypothetical protein